MARNKSVNPYLRSQKILSFFSPLCIGAPMTTSSVIVYVSPMNGKPAKQDTFFSNSWKIAALRIRLETVGQFALKPLLVKEASAIDR